MTHRAILGSFVLGWCALGLAGCKGGTSGSQGQPGTGSTGPSGLTPQKVVVEVDRMAGTPDLKDVQTLRGQEVSLRGIYAAAGLEMEVRHDPENLPSRPTVRLADLHAMMTAFDGGPPGADAWKVHVLIVTQDEDEEGLFGIMFDFGDEDENDSPREGCAVYATAHRTLPGGVEPEMLLTTAHEIAHCFNLHHSDWEGTSFKSDATIESYSFTDTVRWALSSQSLDHLKFATCPRNLVQPGPGGLPFLTITAKHLAGHKSVPDPASAFDIVNPDTLAGVSRKSAGRGAVVRRPAPARPVARPAAAREGPVRLHVHSPKSAFVVGEPVVLTVGLHNEGTSTQSVLPLLHPYHRFLNVEYREPGSTDFRPFRPAVLAEARRIEPRRLLPEESIHEEIPIFFGADGWTFQKAGTYAVRADFPALTGEPAEIRDPDARIESETVEIEIQDPPGERAAAAKKLVLGKQEGLYLLLGGGDHLKKAAENLKVLAEKYSDSAQAPAARAALGIAALKPTVTRAGPTPVRLEEAKRYLVDVLDTDQSPISRAKVQEMLARELEGRGQKEEAAALRRRVIEKLDKEESASEQIRWIRARIPG